MAISSTTLSPSAATNVCAVGRKVLPSSNAAEAVLQQSEYWKESGRVQARQSWARKQIKGVSVSENSWTRTEEVGLGLWVVRLALC